MAGRRVSGRVYAVRTASALVCAILVFYGIPLEWDPANWTGQLLLLLGFLAGAVGLLWMAFRRIGRYLHDPGATGQRIDAVVLLLCAVVVLFALFYYRLATEYPGQFEGLETRTDALYYTIVTLGTVGYGDVKAIGQVARIATMIQIVFDLVVIGTLLAIIATSITHRVDNATEEITAQIPDDGAEN